MIYTSRRLFAELVALLRRACEQGKDIEQIRHDSPDLLDLRAWALREGVSEREWRWQVTRARAYVRRHPKANKRMDSSMRWQLMQQVVSLLHANPKLSPAELARQLNINRITARRYWELAWEIAKGHTTIEEAVWGAAGKRGRPRKRLELPVHQSKIARAVAAVLAAAQQTNNDRAAMRQAALAFLETDEEVELALKLTRQVLDLEV